MFVRRAPLHIGLYWLGSRDRTAWGMTSVRPHGLAEMSVTEAGPFELRTMAERWYQYTRGCCICALVCGFLEAIVSIFSVSGDRAYIAGQSSCQQVPRRMLIECTLMLLLSSREASLYFPSVGDTLFLPCYLATFAFQLYIYIAATQDSESQKVLHNAICFCGVLCPKNVCCTTVLLKLFKR